MRHSNCKSCRQKNSKHPFEKYRWVKTICYKRVKVLSFKVCLQLLQLLIYFVPCGLFNCKLDGPRQANLVLIAYASSEGSGEPAHPRSLARTCAACSYKQ